MPCHALKKSDFHYELPEELIAQAPLPERSASRLLLVPPGDGAFSDLHVRDLPDLRIESLCLNIYHGGTTPAAQDMSLYIDNLVIARRYIGPYQAPR